MVYDRSVQRPQLQWILQKRTDDHPACPGQCDDRRFPGSIRCCVSIRYISFRPPSRNARSPTGATMRFRKRNTLNLLGLFHAAIDCLRDCLYILTFPSIIYKPATSPFPTQLRLCVPG
ncbi:hypothetical protein AG1IA_04782 [Rhizoctonia solani AG-1 IA]|uniref:Uncharacterized protein n=1 Tax=Thanatephorus cucumeris (strain AG1-IA) TaxID=983506 RepID=L8WSS8_THACA|nr:hypothetical protein AG1IA_04782 [Rhizoctonia solani AG-1 IA]